MDEVLRFYSRKDIQREMLKAARNREVAVKYGEKGFGKRPDVLQFLGDILELAKDGVTSFHISEERWSDSLQLKPGMTRKQLDELRTGWDLVIDIDCKDLEYSKLGAHLVIEALKFQNVKNISVKFSGNKGMHIAVPFEAFPEKVENNPTRLLFPEGPKIIALYLGSLIKEKLGEDFLRYAGSLQKIGETFERDPVSLEELTCPVHKVPLISKLKQDLGLVCPHCGGNEYAEFKGGIYICPKCQKFMIKSKSVVLNMQYMECPICGNKQCERKFNPFLILNIDTVLISSRHMFRMPYSYHEKSGLISIPIKPENVLTFKREQAEIKNVKVEEDFMDIEKESDASQLLRESYDWWSRTERKKPEKEETKEGTYEDVKEAIPESYFPPCVKELLQGVSQDGRKRALFILINFLQNVGWDNERIRKYVDEWNKKNYEPLKEGYIISQISYRKKAQKIMPPNCDNIAYYKDIGVCKPDGFCGMIKNPVNYTVRKKRNEKPEKKKGKKS